MFNYRQLADKTRAHYAKWKKKKETQDGHSQAQEAFEKEQTQEEIGTDDYLSSTDASVKNGIVLHLKENKKF